MRRLLALTLMGLTLVVCANASAASSSYTNVTPIAPADRMAGSDPGVDAQQYPSKINVSGVAGSISNVKVTLNGITSTYPGDLDVMLEAPSGRRVMLMSDAGAGNDVTGVDLTFRDDVAQSLGAAQTLTTGEYQPTDILGADGPQDLFPNVDYGPFGSHLSDFNRGTPDGEWHLFVADDSVNDTSVISGGWTLELTTTEGKIVSNSTPIVGVDGGAANPYPSTVDVAGLDRQVDSVTVSINHAEMEKFDDADLLLVSPDGRRAMLVSDAQQGTSGSDWNYTFDDTAVREIPAGGFTRAPVVRPVNYSPEDDAMPAPAPPAPYSSTLSTFKGANPNGRWSLYLADDTANGKVNSINGGWTLNIALGDPLASTPAQAPPAPAPAPSPTPRAQLPVLSLSGLSVAPKAFKASHGAKVLYRLSRSARVKFTIARKVGAHRFKMVRGSLSQAGTTGANRLRLKGKLGGRKLGAGSYRITATPIDVNGHAAASRTATFRVIG